MISCRLSGSDGRVTFTLLPPGRYRVIALLADGASTTPQEAEVEVEVEVEVEDGGVSQVTLAGPGG
jgi:hypothetical protein